MATGFVKQQGLQLVRLVCNVISAAVYFNCFPVVLGLFVCVYLYNHNILLYLLSSKVVLICDPVNCQGTSNSVH